MTETSDFIPRLAALAQATRLEIVKRLIDAGEAGVSVGVLAAETNVPRPTLSIHLQVLLRAELVSSRRDKQSILYSVRPDTIATMATDLADLAHAGPAPHGAAAA